MKVDRWTTVTRRRRRSGARLGQGIDDLGPDLVAAWTDRRAERDAEVLRRFAELAERSDERIENTSDHTSPSGMRDTDSSASGGEDRDAVGAEDDQRSTGKQRDERVDPTDLRTRRGRLIDDSDGRAVHLAHQVPALRIGPGDGADPITSRRETVRDMRDMMREVGISEALEPSSGEPTLDVRCERDAEDARRTTHVSGGRWERPGRRRRHHPRR